MSLDLSFDHLQAARADALLKALQLLGRPEGAAAAAPQLATAWRSALVLLWDRCASAAKSGLLLSFTFLVSDAASGEGFGDWLVSMRGRALCCGIGGASAQQHYKGSQRVFTPLAAAPQLPAAACRGLEKGASGQNISLSNVYAFVIAVFGIYASFQTTMFSQLPDVPCRELSIGKLHAGAAAGKVLCQGHKNSLCIRPQSPQGAANRVGRNRRPPANCEGRCTAGGAQIWSLGLLCKG